MKRFCGMMPSDEIEREERFKDSNDFKINKEFNSEFNYDSQFLHAYKIKFDNLEGDFKYLSKKVFVSPLNNKEKEILNKLNIPMKS